MGYYYSKEVKEEVKPTINLTESLIKDVMEVRARRETVPVPIPVVSVPAPKKHYVPTNPYKK